MLICSASVFWTSDPLALWLSDLLAFLATSGREEIEFLPIWGDIEFHLVSKPALRRHSFYYIVVSGKTEAGGLV